MPIGEGGKGCGTFVAVYGEQHLEYALTQKTRYRTLFKNHLHVSCTLCAVRMPEPYIYLCQDLQMRGPLIDGPLYCTFAPLTC